MENNNAVTAVELAQQAAREFQKSREFQVGDLVKHFKREMLSHSEQVHSLKYLYEIVSPCAHSCDEFGSEYVVYRALYPPYETFVRPLGEFMSRVDKDNYPDVKQLYRFEKLGSENEAEIDCSDIFADMARPEVIVRAQYLMDKVNNDQSTLELTLRDGTKKYFYYNRSNPMPKRYIIEGKTWQEVCGLIEGFWRGSISAGDTVLFSEGRLMNR